MSELPNQTHKTVAAFVGTIDTIIAAQDEKIAAGYASKMADAMQKQQAASMSLLEFVHSIPCFPDWLGVDNSGYAVKTLASESSAVFYIETATVPELAPIRIHVINTGTPRAIELFGREPFEVLDIEVGENGVWYSPRRSTEMRFNTFCEASIQARRKALEFKAEMDGIASRKPAGVTADAWLNANDDAILAINNEIKANIDKSFWDTMAEVGEANRIPDVFRPFVKVVNPSMATIDHGYVRLMIVIYPNEVQYCALDGVPMHDFNGDAISTFLRALAWLRRQPAGQTDTPDEQLIRALKNIIDARTPPF